VRILLCIAADYKDDCIGEKVMDGWSNEVTPGGAEFRNLMSVRRASDLSAALKS
jgi:hypothetical protein